MDVGLRLDLGTRVHCSDASLGELADVVIDPVTKRVTHLVVQPAHEHGEARLIPVGLAGSGGDGDAEIALRCTADEALALAPIERFAYLQLGEHPVDDPDWDVGVRDVLAMPYYPASGLGDFGGYDPNVGMTYDRVPKGEVELRRSSFVTSADGHGVGQVDGFAVDDEDHITHVVLERGHLWGRREVTIPIGAVDRLENDTVILNLSKDEVGALPSVRVHRWTG
jgi:sporulation protein YlmC with PRC-barrel domain